MEWKVVTMMEQWELDREARKKQKLLTSQKGLQDELQEKNRMEEEVTLMKEKVSSLKAQALEEERKMEKQKKEEDLSRLRVKEEWKKLEAEKQRLEERMEKERKEVEAERLQLQEMERKLKEKVIMENEEMAAKKKEIEDEWGKIQTERKTMEERKESEMKKMEIQRQRLMKMEKEFCEALGKNRVLDNLDAEKRKLENEIRSLERQRKELHEKIQMEKREVDGQRVILGEEEERRQRCKDAVEREREAQRRMEVEDECNAIKRRKAEKFKTDKQNSAKKYKTAQTEAVVEPVNGISQVDNQKLPQDQPSETETSSKNPAAEKNTTDEAEDSPWESDDGEILQQTPTSTGSISFKHLIVGHLKDPADKEIVALSTEAVSSSHEQDDTDSLWDSEESYSKVTTNTPKKETNDHISDRELGGVKKEMKPVHPEPSNRGGLHVSSPNVIAWQPSESPKAKLPSTAVVGKRPAASPKVKKPKVVVDKQLPPLKVKAGKVSEVSLFLESDFKTERNLAVKPAVDDWVVKDDDDLDYEEMWREIEEAENRMKQEAARRSQLGTRTPKVMKKKNQ